MYLRGVICATSIYKVFTRHLNVECFESVVPAIFLSYAPTFFRKSNFAWLALFFLFKKFKDCYYFWKCIDIFKCFIDDSINLYVHLSRFWSDIAGIKVVPIMQIKTIFTQRFSHTRFIVNSFLPLRIVFDILPR